jgi:succinyl-diaminopimelate desuccinylase
MALSSGCDYGLNANEILRLTQNMIRIRTTQPDHNELDLVKYILTLFEDYDTEPQVIRHGGNRASLLLTIQGHKRDGATAIIGHLDTVRPVYPDEWIHPPFSADYEDGRIYGNGASNAKGGLASMIAAALYILRHGIVPERDIIFCFTADGDGEGFGAESVYQGGFLENVTEAIFSDPTDAQIGIAQKGVLWLEVTVCGACKHVLEADKSVDTLNRMIEISREIDATLRKMPEHALLGKSSSYITNINSGVNLPYILPKEIVATFDIRYSPFVKESEIIGKLDAIAARQMKEHSGLSIEIRRLISRKPIGIALDAPIVRRMDECYERLGRTPAKMGSGFYSDSSKIVPKLGIPFVLVGPGNWIFSDRGDESVSLDAVLFIARVYIDYLT